MKVINDSSFIKEQFIFDKDSQASQIKQTRKMKKKTSNQQPATKGELALLTYQVMELMKAVKDLKKDFKKARNEK